MILTSIKGKNILDTQTLLCYIFSCRERGTKMNSSKELETLQEAIAYFSDADRCFAYAVKLRWPDGKITCPRCGSERHSFISTRRIWYCNPCKKQFTMKVGT